MGMLVTMLALGVGHWFPWVRRLTRIEAYVYGGASLWLGFAVWRLLNGDWETIVGMLAIDVAGWVAVVGAYRLDEVGAGAGVGGCAGAVVKCGGPAAGDPGAGVAPGRLGPGVRGGDADAGGDRAVEGIIVQQVGGVVRGC